ncbi:PREDICTED: uncharacterized protein LOC109354125 isoform X2 [Lupinus angustifolius]|uniref:uncharacterized protein LOC109354125 isoform X2 n=1 Tax=Lupinus angustifolius TaxID=3871 RepID=UPI00092EA519|nr:PREDICTED: uncharacterized protein LOC109354125 isoform X2 [Lupinus angustifolius]
MLFFALKALDMHPLELNLHSDLHRDLIICYDIIYLEVIVFSDYNMFGLHFLQERQNREKRKGDHDLIRENQENVWDLAAMPSCSVAQPNVSPYEPATITMGNGDGISTHCPTDELLEQNVKILCQISANIDALQLQENVPLFCEVKDNIMKLLNVQVIKSFENLPDAMKKVPPFNFSIDEAEVNSILLQTIFPTQK